MANETFKTNDPFGVLEDEKHSDVFDVVDAEEVQASTTFAEADAEQASAVQGTDGGGFGTVGMDGFFKKPMGEFEATEADWIDQIKLAGSMMFTFDEQEQIDLIQNTLPEADIRINNEGRAIASYRGEEGFVNKPGASWRDFASVAGTLLAFTPAFRTAKYATSISGKAGLVGAANVLTDVAMQETVNVVGGQDKEVDTERALTMGLIGGGGIAVVDKVAKIVAPLIKARGVKKAQETVDEVGIHMRKFEQQNMNAEEAFDRALKTMRLGEAEAEALSHKAGKEFTKATSQEAAIFDAKLSQRAAKFVDETPLLKGGLEVLSDALTPVSTRIDNIAPKIAGGLRRMMHGVHTDLIATEKRVDGFLTGMAKMRKTSPEIHRQVKKALVDGDVNTAERLMSQSDMKIPYEDVRIVLDEMQDFIRSTGGSAAVKDFFPRVIHDYKKLATVLNGKEYGAISSAIERAQSKIGKAGREVDSIEITNIVNKELRKVAKGYKDASRTTKARTMSNIQDDLLDHYADPEEAIQVYLNSMINKKHKQAFARNFTNRKLLRPDEAVALEKATPELRKEMMKEFNARGNKPISLEQDTNTTIQDMVQTHITEGRVLKREEEGLVKLLDSVMNSGQRTQAGFVQDVKNIFYTATLGNPLSALTQLGDIAISAVLNGTNNTVIAAAKSMSKSAKNIRVEDVGISLDRAAEEMTSTTRATAQVLNGMLKWSGFRAVDRLGKRTFINAAHRKLRKEVLSGAKGISGFRDKYKNSFTQEELHQTIESLKAGRVDGNVKFVLWNELSGAQPLTMLEMPKYYLNHPNGRMFYMLKTFTIKQFDIMRRTALDDIAAGRIGRGTKRLAAHNGALLAAGMSVETLKDTIRGREIDFHDKLISGVYRNYGSSEQLTDNLFGRRATSARPGKKASLSKAFSTLALPPVNVADDAWDDLMHLGQQFNSFKHMPLAGALLYNWFGGGIEEANERLEKRIRQRELGDE